MGQLLLFFLVFIGSFLVLSYKLWKDGGGLSYLSLEKKRKHVLRAGPLCLFWTIWKARNKIAFEDATLSIQKLKVLFVYFLWVETTLCIKEGTIMLIEFIEWLGSK